jgi:hypothetical protein
MVAVDPPSPRLPSMSIARRYGRWPRAERLRAGVPHGHWKTTTFVAGLTTRGIFPACSMARSTAMRSKLKELRSFAETSQG